MSKPGLETKLQKIANQIADQVLQGGPEGLALEQKVLAFRELRAFYAMVKKLNPDKDEGGFHGFAESIANTSNRARANGRRPAVDVEPGAAPDEPDF